MWVFFLSSFCGLEGGPDPSFPLVFSSLPWPNRHDLLLLSPTQDKVNENLLGRYWTSGGVERERAVTESKVIKKAYYGRKGKERGLLATLNFFQGELPLINEASRARP